VATIKVTNLMVTVHYLKLTANIFFIVAFLSVSCEPVIYHFSR
jgi:hypothetical protein